MDLSKYPPAPFLWIGKSMDMICGTPLNLCDSWRDQLLPTTWTQPGAYFSNEFRVGAVRDTLPAFLSYREFMRDVYLPQQQQQQYSSSSPGGGEAESFFKQWEGLYEWMFQTDSTTLADLTNPEAIVILLVLVWLLRRVKAILLPWFSTLGRKAARVTHGPQWEQSNKVRIIKFGEYVFRLVFHSAISITGLLYFWNKAWWTREGTAKLFLDFPKQAVEPGMIWYYLIQSAYNLEALLSLLELSFVVKVNLWGTSSPAAEAVSKDQPPDENGTASESSNSTVTTDDDDNNNSTVASSVPFLPIPRISITWSRTARGDFREMFIHHVITNLLVIGSSMFRLTRIGSMVFLVHDISDIPVDLSKLANFLKWKVTTAVCFFFMVIVWCCTRLGVLPFVIFWSVLTEGWMVCSSGVVDPILYVHFRHFFNVLMGLLIFLHLAWFTMFIQMGYVLIRKGEAHDLSEHKKGEVVMMSNGNGKKHV
jgi:TLC domain